jgi:dTDP-4-dehydrorhamnose 3,5-epimerase
MQFIPQKIPDILLLLPKIHGDERGYFMESFRKDLLEDFLGKKIEFIQDNESKSSLGVLRGLHYQLPPYAQSKLVRVISGSVLDIVVDIRKDSPTYGHHLSIELNSENHYQLFIPQGFAHGFVVKSDEAIFSYKVDKPYMPIFERGFVFDDKSLKIDWTLSKDMIQISKKDILLPKFSDLSSPF